MTVASLATIMHLAAGDAADAGDDARAPGASSSYMPHAASGDSSRNGEPGIEQPVDPLAHRQLALLAMPLEVLFAAALTRAASPVAAARDERRHPLLVARGTRRSPGRCGFQAIHVAVPEFTAGPGLRPAGCRRTPPPTSRSSLSCSRRPGSARRRASGTFRRRSARRAPSRTAPGPAAFRVGGQGLDRRSVRVGHRPDYSVRRSTAAVRAVHVIQFPTNVGILDTVGRICILYRFVLGVIVSSVTSLAAE